jgi:glycosyltransferase involved in cell wall biosynthesis
VNIALAAPSWPFKGGIAYHSTCLYRALRERHTVSFYTYRRQYPRWLYPGGDDGDPANIGLREPDARDWLDSLNPLSWLRVARAIAAADTELLILPWWVSFWAPHYLLLLGALRRYAPACKVVFLCHNVLPHDSGRVARWLARRTLSVGDGFVCQTAQDVKLLQTLIPTARPLHVPHPVYDLYRHSLPDRAGARAALRLKPAPTALFFGYIRPYKGLDLLLQALAAVVLPQPLQLVVVGECWYDAEIYRRRVAELGLEQQVRLELRYVDDDDVARWFAAADVLVLPYRSATGSGVLKLAHGCGTPVIASAVGCFAEELHDGEDGLLVPPDDVPALTAALQRFFSEGLGPAMRACIASRSADTGWAELVSALEQAVESKAPADKNT